MLKVVTSITIWNDSAGTRLSVTHSEIDEQTHKIVADNIRENYVLTTAEDVGKATALLQLASELIDHN